MARLSIRALFARPKPPATTRRRLHLESLEHRFAPAHLGTIMARDGLMSRHAIVQSHDLFGVDHARGVGGGLVIAATAQARHSTAAQDMVVSHPAVAAPSTINDVAPAAVNDVAPGAINDLALGTVNDVAPSVIAEQVAPPRMLGDINGDHRVDQTDFLAFSRALFNPANYNSAFDFNSDGRIDIADFGQFSIRFQPAAVAARAVPMVSPIAVTR